MIYEENLILSQHTTIKILDTGMIIPIPKEPIGITNWDGKGRSVGYDKLKVVIDDNVKIIPVNIYMRCEK